MDLIKETTVAGLQRILLVEDNVSLQDIYTQYLKHRGYTVASAVDGYKALEAAKAFSPELVFLDIMMPGMNGFDVAKKLRSDPQYNCTRARIVLLSNLGRDKVPAELNQVVDGYALKAEIQLSDLIKIINSFTPASPTDSSANPANGGGSHNDPAA